MRQSKENDYIRRFSLRKYNFCLNQIDSNKKFGLPVLNINAKGVYAVCGLNGAGKSIFIANLKKIMGLELSDTEIIRCDENSFAIIGGEKYSCKNGETFLDKNPNMVKFIDESFTTNSLRILAQTNLEEWLNQFESSEFKNDDIMEINYLIGKNYESVEITRIEEDESLLCNFVSVKIGGVQYDSRTMGRGEYSLLNLYLSIKDTKNNSILIIEEPETYISIISQRNLMHIICKYCYEKAITVLLTTHSPYLIECLPLDSIGILARLNNDTLHIESTQKEQALINLGMSINKQGVLLVEDEFAQIFLNFILERSDYSHLINRYDIVNVNSCSNIDNFLKAKIYPSNIKIIGVYDGDQKASIEKKIIKKEINGLVLFLPHEEFADAVVKKTVEKNAERLSGYVKIAVEKIQQTFSSMQGVDAHDWFRRCAEVLPIDKNLFIYNSLLIWGETYSSEINAFAIKLNNISNLTIGDLSQ